MILHRVSYGFGRYMRYCYDLYLYQLHVNGSFHQLLATVNSLLLYNAKEANLLFFFTNYSFKMGGGAMYLI